MYFIVLIIEEGTEDSVRFTRFYTGCRDGVKDIQRQYRFEVLFFTFVIIFQWRIVLDEVHITRGCGQRWVYVRGRLKFKTGNAKSWAFPLRIDAGDTERPSIVENGLQLTWKRRLMTLTYRNVSDFTLWESDLRTKKVSRHSRGGPLSYLYV